jgi:hypothetical protein
MSARCFKTHDQYKCVRVTCHADTGLLNSVAISAIMDNPALPRAAVRLIFSLRDSSRRRPCTVPVVSAWRALLCPFKAEVQVLSPWKICGEQSGSGTGVCSQCFCPNLSGSSHLLSIFIHSFIHLTNSMLQTFLRSWHVVKKFSVFFGTLYLPSDLFPSGLYSKPLYALLLFPICATCPTHLVLRYLITRLTRWAVQNIHTTVQSAIAPPITY